MKSEFDKRIKELEESRHIMPQYRILEEVNTKIDVALKFIKEGRELTIKEIFKEIEKQELIKESCRNVLYPQLKKRFTKT